VDGAGDGLTTWYDDDDALTTPYTFPLTRAQIGYTALHKAAGKGHDRVVKLLLAANAQPNATSDVSGPSPCLYLRSWDCG
jgi:hypothetical protein